MTERKKQFQMRLNNFEELVNFQDWINEILKTGAWSISGGVSFYFVPEFDELIISQELISSDSVPIVHSSYYLNYMEVNSLQDIEEFDNIIWEQIEKDSAFKEGPFTFLDLPDKVIIIQAMSK